jgi:hypothetical protein
MTDNETGGDKPATKEKKSWVDRWLAPILLIFFTFTVTTIGKGYYDRYAGRIQELPYYVSSVPGLLKKPDLAGKKLVLMVDGQPAENLSTVSVSVFNNSDTDFDDLPLILIFTNPDGSIPKQIQQIVHAPAGWLDPPPTQPATIPVGNPTELRFTLKVANRNKEAIFRGDFTFEGEQAPTLKVTAVKKGVMAVTKDLNTATGSTNAAMWTPALVIGFISASVLFFYDRRREKKLAEAREYAYLQASRALTLQEIMDKREEEWARPQTPRNDSPPNPE